VKEIRREQREKCLCGLLKALVGKSVVHCYKGDITYKSDRGENREAERN